MQMSSRKPRGSVGAPAEAVSSSSSVAPVATIVPPSEAAAASALSALQVLNRALHGHAAPVPSAAGDERLVPPDSSAAGDERVAVPAEEDTGARQKRIAALWEIYSSDPNTVSQFWATEAGFMHRPKVSEPGSNIVNKKLQTAFHAVGCKTKLELLLIHRALESPAMVFYALPIYGCIAQAVKYCNPSPSLFKRVG